MIFAGGVLVVSGLVRRSVLGIGMAGVGVVLLRFATRRMQERGSSTLAESNPEGTLDKRASEVEVADDIRPQHAN